MCKTFIILSIFALGEVIVNLTWFRYLKTYFNFEDPSSKDEMKSTKKFLLFELSTFKGIMERFILTIGLVFGFSTILIVFGTIKLGTRFKDNQEIKNDYFLIGNFSSILISICYFLLLTHLTNLCNSF